MTLTANRRRSRGTWLASLLVLLSGLVVGVVVWQLWPSDDCGGAFSGFRLNDDENRECIGMTDGGYLFNDPHKVDPNKVTVDADRNMIERINDVQQKIEAENDDVMVTADRYVKVILLMPLTVSQARPSVISLEQILHSLQGAYTGLMRANHTYNFGDPPATKLQLLLANQGSQLEAGEEFIDGILEVSQPEHPVVAVVGLGVSLPNTKTAAEYLAEREIPMVSAVTSADELSNLPLLWSVSPSSTEYVRSLKNLLDNQDVLKSGIVVYDQNLDLYTQSLAQAYRRELGPRYIKYPDQPFLGSAIESPAAPTVFNLVVQNICEAVRNPVAPVDTVFYAGRVADFDELAQALEVRGCTDRPLTVMVGATGFAAAQEYEDVLTRGAVTVIHASSSDSSAWGENAPGTPPGYQDFLAAYQQYASREDADLADGYAIAHHDALVTAAQAIRLAASVRPEPPTPQRVARNGFPLLNLAHAVHAASGDLTFPAEPGRATGRSIPIRQINMSTIIQLPADLERYVIR